MRKIVTWIGALIVVLIGAALILPFVLPANVYKEQVAKRVETATGRTLTIEGDLKLQFFPTFQVEVNEATLGNVPNASSPSMIRMERLVVGVNPSALLRREIIITNFTLQKPEIDLEVAKNGSPNWSFEKTSQSEGSETDAEAATDSGNNMSIVALSDIQISDGKITYINHQTDEEYSFDDVDMTISMANLQSPFSAKGSMIYNQEKVDVEMNVRSLSAFTQNVTSPIGIEISSSPIDVSLDGAYSGGANSKLTGATKVSIPSLKRLDEWSGSALGGDLAGALAVTGELSAQGSVYEFTKATVRFDVISGTGNLKVDGRNSKPKLSGRLDVRELDFRPYMKESETATASTGSGFPAWNDNAINAKVLRLADADFEITTNKLWFLAYEIGASNLSISVRNGILKSNLKRLDLYGGQGLGNLTVDGSGNVPRLNAKLDLTTINAEPLVLAATQRDVLSGLGNFVLNVQTQGRTQKEWMSGLSGSGQLFLKDGEIRGVDLTRMVNVVSSLTGLQLENRNGDEDLNQETGATRKTEFVEMGGTFSIANGILNTGDFRLDNDVISLSGRGTINIGNQTVNLKIDPGLNQEDGGTKVAIKVSGPWNDLTYSPDLQSILKQELIEQLGIEKESPANLLLDALFGGQEAPPSEPEE